MFRFKNQSRRSFKNLGMAMLIMSSTLTGAPRFGWTIQAASPKRVRQIHIVQKDIFDTARAAENKFIYRTVNKLHISTKNRVIRQEMLLQEGDLYDPLLREESERALRKILRLRSARISVIPVGSEEVDLFVQVQETWSTEPILNVSGVGKDLSGKAGFRERNLLGLGKEGSFLYKKDIGEITRSFSYGDPNILGSRLRLDLNYDEREDGIGRFLRLERPFYSTIAPWSGSFIHEVNEEDIPLYDNGRETGRVRREERDLSLGYARSLRSTTRRIRRTGVGYRRFNDRLFSTGTSTSELKRKRYHVLSGSWHTERVRFLKIDHIKLYDRVEDFALGPSFEISVGHSGPWMKNSDTASFVDAKTFIGQNISATSLNLMTLKTSGRFEDDQWRDTRVRMDFEYYNHFFPRQTFAFHMQGEHLTRPDAPSQILLGGDKGLRGYQLNQFAGNKLLLANIENRFFVMDDILKVLSLGTVIFADTGYVWDRGEIINLGDLKTSIGAGLRFHISRSSFGNVLRLDVAYAVDPIPGESRVVITFGSDQAF